MDTLSGTRFTGSVSATDHHRQALRCSTSPREGRVTLLVEGPNSLLCRIPINQQSVKSGEPLRQIYRIDSSRIQPKDSAHQIYGASSA
jgi:hypothetical protein